MSSSSSLGEPILASVEAGGTSFCVSFAPLSSPTTITSTTSIPTTTPAETIAAVVAVLKQVPYSALGVATFGPAGVDPAKPNYGKILNSPKAAWRGFEILGPLLAVNPAAPYKFETDVNAPALSEFKLNKRRGETSCAYITVGTGVGVGLVVNGSTVRGLMHPEGGHVPVLQLEGDDFRGYSWGSKAPWLGKGTVESLASSVAICERLGIEDRDALRSVPDGDPAWDHAANALACLVATLALTVSIERVVMSGGVMLRPGLMEKVRVRAAEVLNGYVDNFDADRVIVPSIFGNDAGKVGALNLAKEAYEEARAGGKGDSGGSGGGDRGGGGGWGKVAAFAAVAFGVGVAVGRGKRY